jgi:FlaA1/EpsC-like NDP-sugar epimerase
MFNTIRVILRKLRILPRWVIVVIDTSIILFSALLGYLLRFNFSTGALSQNHFQQGILVYAACGLISIGLTGSYRGIIRYTGIQDGVRIFFMLVINGILVFLVNTVTIYSSGVFLIPASVIFISLLSSFLFLFNYRLLVKYIFATNKNTIVKRQRVLIFGAGQTGIITSHVIDSTPVMQIVGYLEDDSRKIGKVVNGAFIYDARGENLVYYLNSLSVDELVITARDLTLERKNELVDACLKSGVKVRTVPPVEKWVGGELSLNQIKEVKIEDLLGRAAITLNNKAVELDLRGKRVCITGAAGSIGSELVRQVVAYQPERIILIDQAESPLYEIEREIRDNSSVRVLTYLADITNMVRIDAIFSDNRPEIVFHAAAYKHVPMMEGNPSEAIRCNILGTKYLADLAVKHRISKFVMISTDKAVNPTNVMGCSKRIAEIYVQRLNEQIQSSKGVTAFVTTRFGNVLGSSGSVIPLFKKQIEEGGPVTVTHPEVTRFFMTIPEACQLVLEAGTMGRGGEIFIFDMGKPVRIVDLAHKMISLSGLEAGKDIEIIFTGLREGEKLYEELLNQKENTIPTHHEKILIGMVQPGLSYEEIDRFVGLFDELITDKNELKMVALMKELVPEFKSNYSRYEVLDIH